MTLAVLALLFEGCGGSGSTQQARLTVLHATKLGIGTRQLRKEGGSALAATSEPVSPLYRIWRRTPSDGAVRLRFFLPPPLSDDDPARLMVATRERPDEAWMLVRGVREDASLTVTTKRLSEWQLRLFGHAVRVPSIGSVLGARVDDPRCSSAATGLKAETSEAGVSDPLIYACLAHRGQGWALTIYDNRAIGLEFGLPPGVTLASSRGHTLTESAWEAVNLGLPNGTWRLVPAGGSVTLAFEDPPEALAFRTTSSALLFDLAIAVLGDGKGELASSADLVTYANCSHDAVGAFASLRGGSDLLGALREIWVNCGKLAGGPLAAAGAVAIGGAKLAVGVADALGSGLGKTATVRLATTKPALLPEVRPAAGLYEIDFARGSPVRVGSFDIAGGAATVGQAEAAFGPSSSRVAREGACEVLWQGLGLAAVSADFGTSRPCDPRRGRIQTFVIRSEAFETENGLRIGTSDAELLRQYPGADTRKGDVYLGLDHASGTLYTLAGYMSPIGQGGFLATLQAEVRHGRVVRLEASPWLAGD